MRNKAYMLWQRPVCYIQKKISIQSTFNSLTCQRTEYNYLRHISGQCSIEGAIQ